MPQTKRALWLAPKCPEKTVRLLGAEDGVLRGFGDAEFHDALGRDLDLFAGGGIAADAGLAIDEHEFAEARQGEAVLGVLVGKLGDLLEDLSGLFLGDIALFGDSCRDLGLG